MPLTQAITDKGGPVQMEQCNMESSGFRERLQKSRRFVAATMVGKSVAQGMQDELADALVVFRQMEVALERSSLLAFTSNGKCRTTELVSVGE
jgi:hypothetical protein